MYDNFDFINQPWSELKVKKLYTNLLKTSQHKLLVEFNILKSCVYENIKNFLIYFYICI